MSHSPEANEFVVVHIGAHSDDESIGPPATLQEIIAAGGKVINYTAGVGRPEDYDRRLGELNDACERSGYENVLADPPHRISSRDDLVAAEAAVTDSVVGLIAQFDPDVVITHETWDNHHGHEVVARAVRNALSQSEQPRRLWMYPLWAGALRKPTLYSPFGEERLASVLHALQAFTGENYRNSYLDFVTHRARLNAPLGTETVFPFGSSTAVPDQPYAELFTETFYHKPTLSLPRNILRKLTRRPEGVWLEGEHGILDLSDPFTYIRDANSRDAEPRPRGTTNLPLDWLMNGKSPWQMHSEQKPVKVDPTLIAALAHRN